MKRRNFLQSSSIMSLPFFVGGTPFTAIGRNKLFDLIDNGNDKVLVLVQLQGGNDGLSTLIPLDQYDNLFSARENIMMPENSLIKISDDNGFHPVMTGLESVWKDGHLNIVQGVAYPNQNRSHFRSSDIWHTASEPDEFLTTGWMGRYFDLEHSAYPTGYPNGEQEDPFALTIGSIISETCQGTVSNFSLALTDPFNPGVVNIGEEGAAEDNCYGRELTFIRDIARQTNAYSDTITDAANAGNNLSDKYDDNNTLAQKLKIVARLISGGLQTKIYVVQIGGFDLHSNQVVEGSPTEGRQAQILGQLSDAICAFQEDCIDLGIDDRVVGMTYSEFGRRIASNQSFGTDHGTAAPLIVFGSCVNPEIIGDNPEINPNPGLGEGVAMQYDFRSVYATMLMDWFGISEAKVKNILFKDFQHLPIIECATISSTDDQALNEMKLEVYPNPFNDQFNIHFSSENEWLKLSLYDTIGSELQVISNQKFSSGEHTINLSTSHLSAGIYFVRINGKYKQKTIRVVKAN